MRIPYSWLREFCDPGIGADELALRLAMTGTEVERVSRIGPSENHGNVSLVLPDGYRVGEELSGQIAIADRILELEVTPNRPDCLSVYGVAREVHAVTEAPLAPSGADIDAEAGADGDVEDFVSIEVKSPDLCPRFTARVFTDVEVGPSPLWLKARLVALGQRPINNVVDITNYVMFMTGQPMHAYDLDKVAGPRLIVRCADEGETLTTLDGEVRAFDSDAVLVYDADGPSGIGGIMGGVSSEVAISTRRVLLEAANWHGPNILLTSSKLQLRSEASTRFEKQLHPALAIDAQRIASRLMVEVCGAKLVPGTIDIAAEIPGPHHLQLRGGRLRALLGEEIEPQQSAGILRRLGFGVEVQDDDLLVEVPPERHYDVQREADLVEEVARIHGLDRLPTTLPARRHAVGALSARQGLRRRAEDAVRYTGFSEVVTWSFIEPGFANKLRLPASDDRRRILQLENPLSEDQSAMRTTLLPGLLEAARHNLSAHRDEVRLFESGRVFISRGQTELAREHHHLAALIAGVSKVKSWRSTVREPDFYAAKGVLEALFAALDVEWRLAEGGPSFLHPGKAAQVLCHGHESGWIGELHPLVARSWDLKQPPVGFEVDLSEVLERAPEPVAYVDVVAYPSVFQDIAVVVDEEVEAQTVIETASAGAGPSLADVRIFDVYRGEQAGPGKKSLAMRLEFRSPERTLTEAEVSERREAIKAELTKGLGASIRD